jgi:hypothetical protein
MHLEHSRLFSIEIGTFLVLEAAFKHLDACARAAAAREPRFFSAAASATATSSEVARVRHPSRIGDLRGLATC